LTDTQMTLSTPLALNAATFLLYEGTCALWHTPVKAPGTANTMTCIGRCRISFGASMWMQWSWFLTSGPHLLALEDLVIRGVLELVGHAVVP